MIRHENNDPRRGARDAAERSRQNRLTKYLIVAIGILVALVVAVLVRNVGF